MRLCGGFVVVGALLLAACGGSDDEAAPQEAAADAVDQSDVVRGAADEVQVINGCRIEPDTRCSQFDLRGANLDRASLTGAQFCNTIMPDGTTRNDSC